MEKDVYKIIDHIEEIAQYKAEVFSSGDCTYEELQVYSQALLDVMNFINPPKEDAPNADSVKVLK